MDPLFFHKYGMDDEGQMRRLFWADSQSIIDYEKFGNVSVFDTIYQTNVYKKPLAVLVGIYNHFIICIFPCAMLFDEIVETYEWVFFLVRKQLGRQVLYLRD